jgi:hypothetical protein
MQDKKPFKKPVQNLESFINGGEPEPVKPTLKKEPEAKDTPGEITTPDLNEVAVVARPAAVSDESDEDRGKPAVGSNKVIFIQTDDDFEEFRNYAFKKRVTKTSIIRKALKEYMARNPL